MTPRSLMTFTAFIALAGCAQLPPVADITRLDEPRLKVTRQPGPPNARPGACWGKHTRPAVIETATTQQLLTPARHDAEGRLIAPAEYETVTTSKVVVERQELWFETPCPETFTPEFVATLQRALKARQLFWGPVTGQMDARTRAAVRRYQSAEGLDSPILSLAAARRLGLVETPVDGEENG